MVDTSRCTDDDGGKNSGPKGLVLAFWLNTTFSIVEIVGGLLTNSTAIIADALHDLMDAGAIGLAILMEKVSRKERTTKFSYGFKRFSLLSAIGLSVLLLVGSVTMMLSAYHSFVEPKEVHSLGMLGLALLGLAVNSFAFFRIKYNTSGPHAHSHGNHSNSRSIMLHLLEDMLGWAAVLVGSIIIYVMGWNWVDGVLAICIAVFIGYNAAKNLLTTLRVMLQAVPENVDVDKLQADLQRLKHIVSVHDIHTWSLDGDYNVGSVHVVVDVSTMKSHQAIMDAVFKIMKKHNIQHPTVQIEESDNHCEEHLAPSA
ncbi:cation transporter [Candidatus Saccharibacteria bacterium]|nr:MAG: cation transporter [Candidatus Saccharibacteria bacterium]